MGKEIPDLDVEHMLSNTPRSVGRCDLYSWKWYVLGLTFSVILFLGTAHRPLRVPAEHGCGWTPAIPGESSIASLESVELGGMAQWILIRGADRTHPILLWLHGGPGAAEMPIARRFIGELEEHFVVVHWDQRGAGKSNPFGFNASTMTFQQYMDDAHELTLLLKRRFERDSIYLLGVSWGTQLGIRLAHAWPEDYRTYIAVSQVVDHVRAEGIGYEWLLDRANAAGSASALRAVERLGLPPYMDHAQFVPFAKMIEAYGGGMDARMATILPVALTAPEYCFLDYLRWLKGSTRGSGSMWQEVHPDNLFTQIHRLDVPVYFLSGENDMNTPLQLVREYHQMLDAPQGKTLVVFENAAHTPYLSQPDAFVDVVVEILRRQE